MLLRSSSSPILKSWLPAAVKDPSPDHADLAAHSHSHSHSHPQFRKSCSLSHHSSSISSPSPRGLMTMTRALSEGDLTKPWGPLNEEEEEVEKPTESSLLRLLSSSGLDGIDECCAAEGERGMSVSTLVFGGGGAGIGGRNCRTGGGGGGGGADSGDGSDKATDAYYLKMIESNPSNSLVLGNYAKFLKEVRGDLGRAEEYCERAILADPADADALSLYGDLVWQTSKDAERAEIYFDQAVLAAPQDSFVMASYARFLWDAEEEEEEEEDGVVKERSFTPTPLFQGYIAAAS